MCVPYKLCVPFNILTAQTTCNKFIVVSDLSHGEPVSMDTASVCHDSGSRASSEALVLHGCNVTTTNTWRPGTEVR